jgi:hypothetical protein
LVTVRVLARITQPAGSFSHRLRCEPTRPVSSRPVKVIGRSSQALADWFSVIGNCPAVTVGVVVGGVVVGGVVGTVVVGTVVVGSGGGGVGVGVGSGVDVVTTGGVVVGSSAAGPAVAGTALRPMSTAATTAAGPKARTFTAQSSPERESHPSSPHTH